MRLLFRLLISSLLCFAATLTLIAPALAHPTAGASDYSKATKLLTQGKNFEQAITLLQAAVKADPKNADYHLALGCAYADRAASIGHADMWLYHMLDSSAKPGKPPTWFHPYTKDDDKPFDLSDAQAKAKMGALGKSALAEWQTAILLCHSKKERGRAEYTEGWGLWSLWEFSRQLGLSNGSPQPSYFEMVSALQAATRDDPSNAAYWESLAYQSSELGSMDSADYQRALRLEPGNPSLWYRLFEAYWSDADRQTGYAGRELQSDTGKKALKALQKCIDLSPKNGYPLYTMSYVKLDSTPYQKSEVNTPDIRTPAQADAANKAMEASLTPADRKKLKEVLELMDKAGKLPECFFPVEVPPVPALLSAQWRYDPFDRLPGMFDNARLRELARDFFGVAIADGMEHNLKGAVHAEQDCIRMGFRLGGSWPDKDTTGSSRTIETLVGIEIINIGYDGLLRAEQKYGTPAELAKINAEYTAYKVKRTAYLSRLTKNEPSNIYLMY